MRGRARAGASGLAALCRPCSSHTCLRRSSRASPWRPHRSRSSFTITPGPASAGAPLSMLHSMGPRKERSTELRCQLPDLNVRWCQTAPASLDRDAVLEQWARIHVAVQAPGRGAGVRGIAGHVPSACARSSGQQVIHQRIRQPRRCQGLGLSNQRALGEAGVQQHAVVGRAVLDDLGLGHRREVGGFLSCEDLRN